ncbi:Trans-aconitate 2-methyltransferase [subsurface metagenome]
MKVWHEQDNFWAKWAPILFPKQRWEKTQEEVTNIISLLKIDPSTSVFDLCCGPGRHSLELARRGFSLTGVDRTKSYLEKARKQVETEGLKVEFIQEDMRSFCKPNTFDVAINLFTSFGYFEDIKDDKKVITNVYHSLKNKGVFLIDIMGKEVLARVFCERNWHEVDNNIVLEERKICKNWSWIDNRWILIKDGKKEEYKISHRIYSAVELTALLNECGFNPIDVYGDLTGEPYDHTAKRLILVAHKGKDKT